jgi:hypothetical protein
MANNIAFQPMGKTYKLNTSSSNVQVLQVTADSPVNQYLFINHEGASGQPVYVRISDVDGHNAAVPGNGTANAAYGIPVRPSSTLILTGPQCSTTKTVYISATSQTGTPEIFVVPGEGL